jgi:mRNA interferase RelE/StbE
MGIMYTVEYLESVKEDIRRLPKSVRENIKRAIEKKLMLNPIEFGKPLQYSLQGLRRLRVEDYRIIYQINSKSKNILIVKIGHRKEVYDG